MAVERNEAADRAAELDVRVGELTASLEGVRRTSKSGLMDQVAELQTKVRELSTRRSGNQMRVKEANLWKQSAKQSTEAAAKQRSRLNDFWASEKEADRELEKVRAEATALSVENAKQQVQIKEQLEELTRLKAIAEPGKERFKTKGHFSAAVDLSIVQVLSLGIARKKVPMLYGIFARLFGIKLPGREIMVPGPVVDGERTYIKRFVYHTPGATHCKEMAGVMYQINKLQVGQWLLDYMNSEETSCCYLADGAEAQQLERLGQVLSRRIDGKLQLMALDVNTVESKTGEAQAAAFKQSIEEAVQLMEEAGLVDQRAAELLRRFLPTCACNDRASNGRKAFKLSGKTGFTITQKNRAAYCVQLQRLIFDVHGTEANDLDDGDAGCGGERVVRKRQLGSTAVGGKRKLIDAAGIEYTADEKFEIEQLLDRKMVEWKVRGKKKDYPMYLVLWKGYPPESASWQYPTERKGDGGIPLEMVDEYEAALEAEAELEAEEDEEDEESSMDDE
mmetsp:Transcript_39973/g.80082  ORF Transcript_39973/g.80082 Transcript_39973/m.80082 type:complete len:506 (-) Transcript_39973:208-1725(-)